MIGPCRFQGVIFDMDGVLCDSEPFIAEAACLMFAQRYGVQAKPEDFRPFVGAGEARFLEGVAQKYSVKLDTEADKALTYDIYLRIIKGRLKPLAGAAELIHDLRRGGLRLAVATSSDGAKLDGNLTQIGLPRTLFDACVTGDKIDNKKPHPDIFQRAIRELGLAPPRCLVVEDAPNGLAAARDAGTRSLGLTTTFDESTLRHAGADWIAPDLGRLPPDLFRNQAIAGGGIHHVAIRVKDFDATVRFYTQSLGFMPVMAWGKDQDRAVMLDTGDGSCLEIFAGGAGDVAQDVHFCLGTDNVDAAIARARQGGAKVTLEPTSVDVPSVPVTPVRIAFFQGPGGEIVEFFQFRYS